MVMAVIIVAKVAITTQGIRGWVVSPPLPAPVSLSFDVAEERPAKEKRQKSSLSMKVT